MSTARAPHIGTGPRVRLQPPTPTPAVEQAAAREWAAGWWAGILVGAVNGLALGPVLFGAVR